MSLFRSTLLFFLLACVVGCGFSPLYQENPQNPSASLSHQLSRIEIGTIPERSGQFLRNQLVFLMEPQGQPDQRPYRLTVSLQQQVHKLAARKNSFTTRANLFTNATILLHEKATQTQLLSERVSVLGSFDIVDAPYAALIAKRDAYQDGLTQLAYEIRTRLALYLKNQKPVAK